MNENLPFALCRFFVICAVIPGQKKHLLRKRKKKNK